MNAMRNRKPTGNVKKMGRSVLTTDRPSHGVIVIITGTLAVLVSQQFLDLLLRQPVLAKQL